MKILCIGDIFAKTGRRAIIERLNDVKKENGIDFVIANCENATHCKGLIKKHYEKLLQAGIDFFTMGNHTWSKDEIYELLKTKFNIIRPYNIVKSHEFNQYGVGSRVVTVKNKKIRITNLLGNSVHFNHVQTNPFYAMDEILEFTDHVDINIVDLHFETTSEKNAFFFDFKGKITCAFGTHTHVQTSDERIIDGTAYITDIGMTGPHEGVIGASGENIVKKFRNIKTTNRLEEHVGKWQFCYIIVEIDETTNKAVSIKRYFELEQK